MQNHPLQSSYPASPGYPNAPPSEPYPPYPQGQPSGFPQPTSNIGFAMNNDRSNQNPGHGNPPYPMGSPPAPGYAYPQQHGYPAQVVSSQPVSAYLSAAQPLLQDGWMSIPIGIPNCPRGLEYLTTIDQLIVKQKLELMEVMVGFETNNKYTIRNNQGQKVYYAIEDNDCCTRLLCGSRRPFDLRIFDNFKNEVIHLYRPLRCGVMCLPCCQQEIQVSAPPGNVIGSIEQECSLCMPSWQIKNSVGDVVMRIEGPFCVASICGGNVDFNIVSLTGANVGKISKHWSGMARELFTDSDTFGISFPMDLDVRIKALLLGATFLIDMMYFEKGNGQN